MSESTRMRILGVDPGTIVMGYGVVDSEGDRMSLVSYGTLDAPARAPIGERLSCLYRSLVEVISRHRPDVMAVEQPFVMSRNVKSALAIGRAQAIAILAAANNGLPSYEYSPAQVKQRVADYGAGSKEQVQQMVAFHLGLSRAPEPSDAADALAVAICHLQESHVRELLERQSGETA